MDRPKEKRVWINQDVIDGPRCILTISHYSIDGYLAVGLVTAGDDIVYVEEIHAYEERIEFKIDENYDDFVKGNKSDFEDSIQAQLVSILQCEPLNVRDLEVSPGSIMVNFTLVGSNDMEADELKQSHAELIALLEAGALKLVSFLTAKFQPRS